MTDQTPQYDPQRGFDVDRFVPPPPPEDLLCQICHGVLNNPKLPSGCQHLFCSACIHGCISTTTDVKQCPVCRVHFHDLTNPQIASTSTLNRLRLQCSFANNGCNETLTVETVLRHESKCMFAPVRCPNQGCTAVGLLRNNLNQHTRQCKWRVVECPNGCNNSDIRERDLQRHLAEDCDHLIVECSLGCGATRLQRKDLNNHIDNTCAKRLVRCIVAGCGFRGEAGREDLWKQHMADDGRSHLELVMTEIMKLQGEVSNLRGEAEDLREEVSDLRSKNEAVKAKLEDVETENMQLKTNLQRMESNQDGFSREIARVEQLNTSTKQTVERVQTSVTDANTAMDALKARIETLENFSEETVAQLKRGTPRLNAVLADVAIKNAHLVVANVATRWDSGIDQTSEQLTLAHQDPQLRYPFQLRVFTTTVDNKKYLQVNFIPRRGDGEQQLKWPITNHIRVSAINTKGGSDKVFVLQGEKMRHFFTQHNPPHQNNWRGEGWRLLDKAEIDGGDFVDANGNVLFKAEILPQVFITEPARDRLVGLAKAKGCEWVVEGVRTRWGEGVRECSPQLTLTHPNPSLQYPFLLSVYINLTHCNEGHVGVYFIPRVGAQLIRWPIQNHIKVTVLALSPSHNHKVRIINDSGAKESFSRLGTPPQHNFDKGWGWNEFLSKEEVFGGGYVDENDRMFIKVEVMNSTFD